MLKLIVAVRDRAVDAFGQPFFVRHELEAVRSFKDEINRDKSDIGAHADDYDLYVIGTYDDASGVIVGSADGPKMLAVGKSLVDVKNIDM